LITNDFGQYLGMRRENYIFGERVGVAAMTRDSPSVGKTTAVI